MSDTVICLACGQENDAIAQVCENCGEWLPDAQNQTLLSTKAVRLRAELKEILAEVKEIPELKPAEIALHIIDFGDFIELNLSRPVLLGRGDKVRLSTTQFIDLSNYNAYGLGLSRDHAEIHYEEETYYLADLGSSNGTSVNGHPISSNEPCRLEHGDKIFLGKLGIIFYCG